MKNLTVESSQELKDANPNGVESLRLFPGIDNSPNLLIHLEKFKSVRILNVSETWVFQNLAKILKCLPNLEKLYACSNDLNQIGNLEGLGNHLKVLDLGLNAINTVPESLFKLPVIEEIDLRMQEGGITTFPSTPNRSSLKKLILRGNNIQQLPPNLSGLSKLENIDLSENNLTSFPQSLTNLPSNILINISNNKRIQNTEINKAFGDFNLLNKAVAIIV
jgi:Leucine-rich repeat (LRR) protein